MTQLNACLHVLMKLDVGFVNDYFFLNEFLSQYSIHQVDSGAGYLQMDCSARLGCFLDFVQFPKSTKNKRDSFFVIISDKCITKVCEIKLEILEK